MSKISIIIPCRNEEKFISNTLKSIIEGNFSVGKCFYLSGIYGGSPAKFIKELVNE